MLYNSPNTRWLPPVATSLLLHAAMFTLISLKLSGSHPDNNMPQIITVELSGVTPANKTTLPRRESAPVIARTVPITAKPEPDIAAHSDTAAPHTAVASTEPPQATPQQSDSAAAPQPSGLTIHPLGELSRPPAFRRKIEPAYPAAEQRAGSQANVVAEVTLDEQGNVHGVRIVKSAGQNFDLAVIEALKKSQFAPGYIGQDAVAVRVLVPFRFKLN